MTQRITAVQLFEQMQGRLALRWLAGIEMRPLPSGSANAAAPTSLSCSRRLFFLVRGKALTWSRTFSQTPCG